MNEVALRSVGPDKQDRLFRPSAGGRWLACAGSVMLCRSYGDSAGSGAAREGTAIHRLLEAALRYEREAIEWIDRTIDVEGYQIVVDEGMADCAEMAIDYVRSRAAVYGAILEVEYRLSLSALDAADPLLGECGGTADAILLFPNEGILEIVDLKSGRGYMVPANAKQLRLYALMAMLHFKLATPWREIRTTIVQPRDPDIEQRIRTHIYNPAEIWEFAGEVCAAIYAAVSPNAPLVPGPEQCEWCPAKGDCPALAANALDVARSAFAAVPMLNSTSPMPPPGPAPSLPNLDDATNEEIALWLARRELVELWFKGVEERAARRLTIGQKIPGWKMVNRTGHRKFIDRDKAVPALRRLGLTDDKIFQPLKLQTPAQIEKALPKSQHAALADMVEAPAIGLALVPESNKKPAAIGVFGPAPTIDG